MLSNVCQHHGAGQISYRATTSPDQIHLYVHSDTDFTISHVTTCNLQDSPLTNKGEGKEFVISVLC